VDRGFSFPLGTVRLMEQFDLAGPFTPEAFGALQAHIRSVLRSQLRGSMRIGRSAAVACGGNAEALARVVPGPRVAGFNTLNLRRLREMLWEILRLDVEGRMDSFGVRRDRAEVMGVAAVVFATLAEQLDLRQLIIPGVGVREGVLHELAAAHFGPASAHDERAEALRQQARRFAARMHSDAGHCEHVRRLAAQLFDQMAPVHELPSAQRVTLELGALLHDVGIAVNARGHHKHGEYLVRHADIPGLSKHQQSVVACLVRYHGESTPDPHHRLYSSLAESDRTRVRQLAALLRIAVALDAGETQVVRRVDLKIQRRAIVIRIVTTAEAQVNLRELRRKARFFEREFGLPLRFACVRRLQNGNGTRRSALPARRSAA
jgi:exopolyphosphatase/guanosine-5'-triphosphate,3'-diphosphate pyrophosphatase